MNYRSHNSYSYKHCSVCWPDYYYGHDDKIGDIPRIIDPGNPAANYYYRGIIIPNNQYTTENAWDLLAQKIDTLDLARPLDYKTGDYLY